MPHISEDRVLENGSANTTVSFTLSGAVTGFRTFASQLATNDTCWYAAWQVDGSGVPTGNWENGLGTLTAGTTLTRTSVLESSNAAAAVTFTGSVRVALTLTAARVAQFDNVLAMFLPAATAEPAVPSAGIRVYGREIVPGFTVMKNMRPSGVDTPMQDGLMFNRFVQYRGSNTALTNQGAGALTTAGTLAAVTPASGSAKNQVQRVQIPSTATAGNVCAAYSASAGLCPVLRGNVNGEGGFRVGMRFALNALQTGNRGFFGLVDVVSAPTNVDPTTSTTPGKVGLAFNANTGNWRLVNCVSGTTPTSLDLGANFPIDTTSLMELVLFCRPHNGTSAGDISYRVRRYTTNSNAPANETTGTLTTNIPAATTLLHPSTWMTNNAQAAAVSYHLNQLTIESDF